MCSDALKLSQCKNNKILLATWKTREQPTVESLPTSGVVVRRWVWAEQANAQTVRIAEKMEEGNAAIWVVLKLLVSVDQWGINWKLVH